MEWAALILEYVKACVWPVTIGLAVSLFRRPIAAKIADLKATSTPVGDAEFFDRQASVLEIRAADAAERQDEALEREDDRTSGSRDTPVPGQPSIDARPSEAKQQQTEQLKAELKAEQQRAEQPGRPPREEQQARQAELRAELKVKQHRLNQLKAKLQAQLDADERRLNQLQAEQQAWQWRKAEQLKAHVGTSDRSTLFRPLYVALAQLSNPPDFSVARSVVATSPPAAVMLAYSGLETVARAAWTQCHVA